MDGIEYKIIERKGQIEADTDALNEAGAEEWVLMAVTDLHFYMGRARA